MANNTSSTTLEYFELINDYAKETMHNIDIVNQKVNDFVSNNSSLQTALNAIQSARKTLDNIAISEGTNSANYKRQLQNVNNLVKQYQNELQEVLDYKKKITKEQEWQNKLSEEGATLEEKKTHILETHLKGYAQINKGIGEIKKGFSEILNLGKDFYSAWSKLDQAAMDYTRTMGGTVESYKTLRKETLAFMSQQNIAGKYGTSMQELLKLQTEYNKSLGRAVNLTNSQKESMVAMRRIAGEQGALDWSTKLENFGLNPDEVGKRMGDVYKGAAKSGVAFEKLSKNMLDNIKMAQNYTFTNGLKGLESMAKKAAAINLDMRQVSAFAEKVSTLEGAMETGASLSVLGGSFSQLANPLTMMYESLSDMEGLQDRVINMFGNMAKFNSKTGELEIGAYDKMRIKEASKAMGIDYSSVMDMIMSKGRANRVEAQLGNGYTAEQRELIKNTAQLDNKGNAFVTINGEKKNIKEGLTAQDLKLLQATGNFKDSDNLKTIAQSSLSANEKIEAIKESMNVIKAEGFDKVADLTGSVLDTLRTNFGILIGIITAGAIFKGVKGVSQSVNGIYNFGKGLNKGWEKSLPKETKNTTNIVEKTNKHGKTIYRRANGQQASKAEIQAFKQGNTSITAPKASKVKNIFKTAKLGTGVIGGGIQAISVGIEEFSQNNGHTTGEKIARSLGTGILTGVATAVNPLLGMAVGAISDFALKQMDKAREKFKHENGLDELKGNYSKARLKRIKQAIDTGYGGHLTDRDVRLLRETGDYESFEKLVNSKVRKHATGGWVNGVGTETSDSNLRALSKGEFVVNASSAKKFSTELEAMNKGFDPLTISAGKNAINSLKVNGSASSTTPTNVGAIDFGKGLTLNIGGTIKLDLGNGKNIGVNYDELFTPQVISKLTKEISTVIERSYNKETFRGFKYSSI